MKQTIIGILSPSPIIESGISVIVNKIHSPNYDVRLLDAARLSDQISHLAPEIIIADTASIDRHIVEEMRESAHHEIKLVGIVHSALPQHTLALLDAVISIYDSPSIIETVLRKLTSVNEEEEPKSLSQREKDVVIGIAKGMSNKEIAVQMNVSVNTVMTHRRNISSKLKIHSPAGLTIYAIVSKLIKLEDIKTHLP